MGRFIKDLWNRFCNENIVGKYIYVNVAIFVVVALVTVIATLFNVALPVADIIRWLELPADPMQLLYQPWSIVTYMFIHGGFLHMLWNMMALYVFGRIFLQFYSTRHFTGVYFLGAIVGGLFFVLAFNLFPHFEQQIAASYLVGASAAVLAVVVAAAVRAPGYVVNMLFVGAVKLRTLAIVTVVVSFLLLASENAGGNFAHIGGALAGWVFAVMLNKGHDVTSLINAVGDFFSKAATTVRNRRNRPKPKFTHSSSRHSVDYEYNARKKEKEETMNRILEKIKQSGYSSLSEEEKKQLFNASR